MSTHKTDRRHSAYFWGFMLFVLVYFGWECSRGIIGCSGPEEPQFTSMTVQGAHSVGNLTVGDSVTWDYDSIMIANGLEPAPYTDTLARGFAWDSLGNCWALIGSDSIPLYDTTLDERPLLRHALENNFADSVEAGESKTWMRKAGGDAIERIDTTEGPQKNRAGHIHTDDEFRQLCKERYDEY